MSGGKFSRYEYKYRYRNSRWMHVPVKADPELHTPYGVLRRYGQCEKNRLVLRTKVGKVTPVWSNMCEEHARMISERAHGPVMLFASSCVLYCIVLYNTPYSVLRPPRYPICSFKLKFTNQQLLLRSWNCSLTYCQPADLHTYLRCLTSHLVILYVPCLASGALEDPDTAYRPILSYGAKIRASLMDRCMSINRVGFKIGCILRFTTWPNHFPR